GRSCALDPRIKLLSAPKQAITVGVALTVKSRAGDNLMLHKALNMAQPGDIIIASNEGGVNNRSLMGEIMFTFAAYKKLTGLILDGPIRDIDAASKMEMPIYGTGTTPGGPYKEGPGEINVPISCGGISVNPGDIIVMDADGIIIIPLADASAVLAAAQEFQKQDAAKVLAAANGTAHRGWVDKKLLENDIEIIDGYYK
ncbi:MAG: RraA family protein, partial [Acholeplasmataceae bacterium]|nr:RraA family protein [Acholeplasmataceae bacterium]